jgi:hypothetical protein
MEPAPSLTSRQTKQEIAQMYRKQHITVICTEEQSFL